MLPTDGTPRNRWVILAAALCGLFSVGFSITVLSVALPDIAADFHVTANDVVWVITGPILLGAVITPAAGKVTDLFGARRVYLIAMTCVAGFAALTALAWSAPTLILFRVLGAALGSATAPAAMALINRLFERHERAKALGYWSMVAAGAPVLGVVVGGPVVQYVSWRWIFIAQVPLSLLTVLVCARIFPETPRTKVSFDYVGAALLAFGSASFVVALNRAPEVGWGWTHPVILTMFVASPVFLVAFVIYERGVEHQLIPMRYFRSRNFAFPLTNQFFANFAYMGGFFLTPFLLRDILGYDQTTTGLVSIARPIAFTIAGPVTGWAATRIGERTNGLAGGVFLAASMALFASVGGGASALLVFGALILSGIGMGTTAPAMTAAAANAVDDADLGVAGGAQQMFGQLGVVVGTQVMFTIKELGTPADIAARMKDAAAAKQALLLSADDLARLAPAYHQGYAIGGLGALAAIAAAWGVRSTVRRERSPEQRDIDRIAVETALAEAV